MSELRGKLALLTLSNQAVWDREEAMYKQGQGVKGTPWFVKIAYLGAFSIPTLFFSTIFCSGVIFSLIVLKAHVF